MNLNTPTIVVVAIIAIIAVIVLIRKAATKKSDPVVPQPLPVKPDSLEATLAPIKQEIETKQIANLIKHWTDKFANNTLTVQDVELLNAKLAEGNADQVSGILALHPNGRTLFHKINTEIKEAAVPVV